MSETFFVAWIAFGTFDVDQSPGGVKPIQISLSKDGKAFCALAVAPERKQEHEHGEYDGTLAQGRLHPRGGDDPGEQSGDHAFAEAALISALQTFDDLWGQLFPAEQT